VIAQKVSAHIDGANSNRKRNSYVKELVLSVLYSILLFFNRTVVMEYIKTGCQ